ncbi:hypothetical protein B0H14DRAFT_2881030 [Mycena olivaceomarginata]|nr:hypothetical protein B0H14DRAFT_2881030 [Mycena olivaceomarginata]
MRSSISMHAPASTSVLILIPLSSSCPRLIPQGAVCGTTPARPISSNVGLPFSASTAFSIKPPTAGACFVFIFFVVFHCTRITVVLGHSGRHRRRLLKDRFFSRTIYARFIFRQYTTQLPIYSGSILGQYGLNPPPQTALSVASHPWAACTTGTIGNI